MRAIASKSFDQRARSMAAGLLIGGKQHPQWPSRPAIERLQGIKQAHDSALHIEHARTAQLAIPHAHRIPLDAADRPDGIVMAERQGWSLIGPARHTHEEVLSCAAIGEAFHRTEAVEEVV